MKSVLNWKSLLRETTRSQHRAEGFKKQTQANAQRREGRWRDANICLLSDGMQETVEAYWELCRKEVRFEGLDQSMQPLAEKELRVNYIRPHWSETVE